MPSLNRTSWQTAERTGALGYMEYADVKAYNELYELQDVVVDSQRALLARLSGLLAFIGASEGADPTKSRAQDSEACRTRGLRCDWSRIHSQVAGPLVGGRIQEGGHAPTRLPLRSVKELPGQWCACNNAHPRML